VNKSGGPDRRFRDNRELPVCAYEEIRLQSATGLNEVLQVSRTGVAVRLQHAISRFASVLESAGRMRISEPVTAEIVQSKAIEPSAMQPQPYYGERQGGSVPSQPIAPDRSTVPTAEFLFESLFLILCCLMAADGRASSSEKSAIAELMRRAGARWEPAEVASRISRFIEAVSVNGYKSLVAEALTRVPVFVAAGRQDILLRSISTLANASERGGEREAAFVGKIQRALQESLAS
jgi:hypothetical protein